MPMVTVALPPRLSVPRLHATESSAWLQLPWLASAATKVTPAGSVWVSVAPGALIGPAFWTIAVYVMSSPIRTGSGSPLIVADRSASGGEDVVASQVTVGRSLSQYGPL